MRTGSGYLQSKTIRSRRVHVGSAQFQLGKLHLPEVISKSVGFAAPPIHLVNLQPISTKRLGFGNENRPPTLAAAKVFVGSDIEQRPGKAVIRAEQSPGSGVAVG